MSRSKRKPRLTVYLCVGLLAVVLLPVVFKYKVLVLAYHMFLGEGGRVALTATPLRVGVVGLVANVPLPHEIYLIADNKDVGSVAIPHRDGCFTLGAPGPATIRSMASGFQDVLVDRVENGYFAAKVRFVPAGSENRSSISLSRISAGEFIRRTARCTSKP